MDTGSATSLVKLQLDPANSNSAFSNSPLFGTRKPFAMDLPIDHLLWANSNCGYFELLYHLIAKNS